MNNKEIYNEVYRQQLELARQDVLNQMKYEQEYKRLRHIGQLDEAQRDLDRHKHNSEDLKLLRQSWIHDKICDSESKLIRDDLNGINVNDIVDRYREIAQRYNDYDQNEVHHIIEEAIKNPSLLLTDRMGQRSLISNPSNVSQVNNIIYDSILNKKNISCNEIEKYITDDNMRQEFSQFAQEHYNGIDVRELLDKLVENRIKTTKGIVGVAPIDIEARTTGVNQKMASINNIRCTGIVSKNYYEDQINREQERKEQLEEESKKAFLEARDSQRIIDNNIRKQQFDAISALAEDQLLNEKKGVTR